MSDRHPFGSVECDGRVMPILSLSLKDGKFLIVAEATAKELGFTGSGVFHFAGPHSIYDPDGQLVYTGFDDGLEIGFGSPEDLLTVTIHLCVDYQGKKHSNQIHNVAPAAARANLIQVQTDVSSYG